MISGTERGERSCIQHNVNGENKVSFMYLLKWGMKMPGSRNRMTEVAQEWMDLPDRQWPAGMCYLIAVSLARYCDLMI